ncbi:MAG: acyclic terpene utilization AtuA family protein [Ferruginibacter sp.]
MQKEKIRIGCGAGFSGDRIEPAVILAERGNLDYLVLECLAERTIALAQKRKMQNPRNGYDPLLERRINTLLPLLVKNNICLVTNMGAANPIAAAKKINEIARQQHIKIKVAAVYGDDVFDKINRETPGIETSEPISASGELISANAYMGIDGILEALNAKPNIIITGRVADPSLFLAPMIHEFGWKTNDYDLLGKGSVIGHLLECAGQVTGGYFADPYKKPVPDLAHLGHPFADVFADGTAIISKTAGTGGIVNLATVKEQLLYEVINPHEYYTPDVIADFTTVRLIDLGNNQVQVVGGTGKEKPRTYKVSAGYKAFYLGEGEISYAGFNALERAKLAGEIIKERLKDEIAVLKIDFIGFNSVHHNNYQHANIPSQYPNVPPYEIRLRVAGKANTAEQAALVGEEVEALYTNGPAGGGGVRKYVTDVIGIVSILIDRKKIIPQVKLFQS